MSQLIITMPWNTYQKSNCIISIVIVIGKTQLILSKTSHLKMFKLFKKSKQFNKRINQKIEFTIFSPGSTFTVRKNMVKNY